MASKKYTMMLGLLGLISTAAFAQDSTVSAPAGTPADAALSAGTSADDSWIYNPNYFSNTTKQASFANHTAAYPSRPKDMWELGIGVGGTALLSPIDPKLGESASFSLRKAVGNVFSIRAQYNYGIYYGQDWRARTIADAPANVAAIYKAAGKSTYLANFKATIQQVSLDGIFSLNTISHYRGNPKVEWYLLGGYSFVWGSSRMNALDQSGKAYTWGADGDRVNKSAANSTLSAGQKNGIFDMKSGNGQKYETEITNRDGVHGNVPPGTGGSNISRHGADLGGGVAFRVSSHFNIGIEQKFTYIFDNGDYSGVVLQKSQRADLLSNTQIRFNFNLGNSSKRVEPLWWVNPNNYIYDRLAVKDVLPDADGDGVTDQFDLEPNTPAGCAVDTHGRSLDTDGDGVPDCRDKQVLTPQNWFPVDADGVGTEPTPQCCKDLLDSLHNLKLAPAGCGVTSLPSVQFNKSSVRLDDAAKASLDAAVAQLNANPDCKVKLVGYGASNKRAQQLSWDRVNAVKTYLVQKGGISEGRIIFTYGYDGDANTVDLQPTTEEGPSTVPAPHPNLQKS